MTSIYLVPESFSVQGDDDHGRVGEEAPIVEGQVFPLPRHIQHVPAANRSEKVTAMFTVFQFQRLGFQLAP